MWTETASLIVSAFVYAPESPANCGFVLVVETRYRTFALRVSWAYKPGVEILARDVWTLEPFLAAIVQLDPRRSQIVIARDHGAANAFVSFAGLVNGKLAPLSLRPREYADQLSLFGTVGTGMTSPRCRRRGPLVILGLGPTSQSE